jgi:hypothetical protein
MSHIALGIIPRSFINDPTKVRVMPAEPLDGYDGGGLEYRINAANITSVVVVYRYGLAGR